MGGVPRPSTRWLYKVRKEAMEQLPVFKVDQPNIFLSVPVDSSYPHTRYKARVRDKFMRFRSLVFCGALNGFLISPIGYHSLDTLIDSKTTLAVQLQKHLEICLPNLGKPYRNNFRTLIK